MPASAVAVPVLTWHPMNVAGPGYAANEHVAFREDLETLHRLGRRVVLSFDDGSDFDWYDLPHPAWGPQRGMGRILADFRARHGAQAQPTLHATSFSVVSREAREALDRTCMIGCRWWNDDWWPEAEASGLMAIESHGWDHNHESLERTVASAPRGAFDIATKADADAEIAQASRELRRLRGRGGDVLFAYPYGPASPYLAGEYLPGAPHGHGVYAAFTTDAQPVSAGTSRWSIPRFVFGWHWKSPGELEALLR
jgi:peptidoglycan/xylan/chitin deacetylase (PgdA/CDA1 family)